MYCKLFFQSDFSNSASKKSHEHQSNKDNHLDNCFDLGETLLIRDDKITHLDDRSDLGETDNNIAEEKLRQRRTMDNSRNSPPLINIISLFIILSICTIFIGSSDNIDICKKKMRSSPSARLRFEGNRVFLFQFPNCPGVSCNLAIPCQ